MTLQHMVYLCTMGSTATVLGASGYAGGEVLRLLSNHPAISVACAAAARSAGRTVGEVHPHLRHGNGTRLVPIEEALTADVDVVFSCLPAGELGGLRGHLEGRIVIDLSDEHRAAEDWVYGLTEFARDSFPATQVANPGCYPTATLLALLPFVHGGKVSAPMVVDAISGTTGAGRKLEDRLLHGAASGNVGAYGSVDHRHIAEMERAIARWGKIAAQVSFTPHLAPLKRGLVATVRARLVETLAPEDALALLRDRYEHEPFVHVVDDWPGCAAVAGTNHALVSARVDQRTGWLVAACAIDNLGKGAAGQAVQNANLALGLAETLGLDQVAAWP